MSESEIEYTRQLDLIDPADLRTPITLIGAGGVGSTTALALTKLGCQALTLYDADTVDAHNVPNQLFRPDAIGQLKVEALWGEMLEYSPALNLHIHPRHWTPDDSLTGIVVSAVDTMATRADIWQTAKRSPHCELVIDPRLGGDVVRLFAARPHLSRERERYEATLYTDEEADPLTCHASQTWYTVTLASALIANVVARHARNDPLPPALTFDFATLRYLLDDPDDLF